MKRKRISLAVIAALLVATLTLPVAAVAQRGEGQARAQSARQTAEERREAISDLREQRTEDIQRRVEARRAQVRSDVCERRQDQASQLVPRLANQTTRLLATIDGVHERVQGFYETGQLTVANYDDLNDSVLLAQADAQAAAEVVVNYEFEFDCENPSLGNQTFAFRSAVSEAREALKEYRAQLVTLISSLRAAAAEQNEARVEENDDTNNVEEEGDE